MTKMCGLCHNPFEANDERRMVCNTCAAAIVEECNTPDFSCGHCDGKTEFIVEFRDLVNDEVRLRSLCRPCAIKILEDI